MTRIYIALGSNKGDSAALVTKALEELELFGSHFLASPLYSTEPIDCEGGSFTNAVCSLETLLELQDFIPLLEGLEKKMGKTPKSKGEARFMDLDILFYGSGEYSCLGYTIPHPSWQTRSFVLKPLSDIISTVTVGDKTFNIKNLCKKLS
ncbi:MAG: 2-amino-4-hydroxy-6-hydroxymethyldihydropteridine diphosphokinase [Chlamydiota bacterium]